LLFFFRVRTLCSDTGKPSVPLLRCLLIASAAGFLVPFSTSLTPDGEIRAFLRRTFLFYSHLRLSRAPSPPPSTPLYVLMLTLLPALNSPLDSDSASSFSQARGLSFRQDPTGMFECFFLFVSVFCVPALPLRCGLFGGVPSSWPIRCPQPMPPACPACGINHSIPFIISTFEPAFFRPGDHHSTSSAQDRFR